jgi:hypothetical protein
VSKHTPGPWVIGSLHGQHLPASGGDKCALCDKEWPLVKVSEEAINVPKWSATTHWHLREDTEYFRSIVSAGGEQIVGQFDYDDGGVCTTRADARLIAAAPDGLAIAERMYLWLLGFMPGSPHYLLRVISQSELCALRDFIAKATGREPREVQEEFEALASKAEEEGT